MPKAKLTIQETKKASVPVSYTVIGHWYWLWPNSGNPVVAMRISDKNENYRFADLDGGSHNLAHTAEVLPAQNVQVTVEKDW